MSDISFDALDLIQQGQDTADMFKKVANQARNEACSFFKGSPGTVVPIPGSAAVYFFWQSFCKNSSGGLPQSPAPPFQGGQCPVAYRVNATWNLVEVSTGNVVAHTSTLTTGGRIESIDLRNGPTGESVGLVVTWIRASDGLELTSNDTYGGAPQYQAKDLNITSIIRVDGQPDNCGNLPSDYPISDPPPTPTTTGGNTYNLPSINVTFNDGSTKSFNANLTINAGLGFPSLTVGDIGLNLNGGGITINNNGGTGPGGGTPDLSLSGQLNVISNNVANLNNVTNNINNNTANITNNTNQIKDDTGSIKKNTDPPPKPGGPGTKPPSKQPDNQRKKDDVSKLISVQVIVTTPPSSTLQQFGQEGSSDVWYTGWFTWRQAGHDMMKLQISYLDSIFLAPKGADGYGFTLTHGALGYAIENTGTEDS